MALADRKHQVAAALLGAIANTANLKPPAKTCADALHHISEQSARQAMLRAVFTLVSRALHFDLVVFDLNLNVRIKLLLEDALRAVDGDQIPLINADRHFGRQRNWHFSNPRHGFLPYHTLQRISPPRRARRALRPVISPFGVEIMLIPSPLRTHGISLAPL